MAATPLVKLSQLRNPDELKKSQAEAVIHYLGRLAKYDHVQALQAIRYVIDGQGDEVLLALGGKLEAAQALLLDPASWTSSWNLMEQANRERAKMFQYSRGSKPGVWIRLGQLLAAVSRVAGMVRPQPLGWVEWLVVLVGEILQAQSQPHWPVQDLEAILLAGDLPGDLLARTFFHREAVGQVRSLGTYAYFPGGPAEQLTDWPPYLAVHLETVRAFLAAGNAEQRVYALQTLHRVGFDFAPVIDLLVEIGTGPAKTARDTAWPLITDLREQARPHIERILTSGDAGSRHEVVQLLWRIDGAAAAERLRRHAEQESSERIKQTIEKFLAAPADSGSQAEQELELPPIQLELGEVPFPEPARAEVRACFDRGHEQALKQYERAEEQWNSADRPKWMSKPVRPNPVLPADLERVFAFVEGKVDHLKGLSSPIRQYAWNKPAFSDAIAPPRVKLIHMVRLALAFEHLNTERGGAGFWWHNTRDLEDYRGRCQEPFGLRELDAAVATLPGGRPGMVGAAYLASNNNYHNFCNWESAAIWPLFAERSDMLREVLGVASNRGQYDYTWPEKRRNAFRVLAMFPRLPAGFMPLLWDLALGEGKTDRPLAQAALATVPDKSSKIIVALKDGKQTIRAAAAEWLGQLGDAAAIEPLKAAFRAEKQEFVKGAMIAALEALGAEVQEFLDRGELLAEAETGLSKKKPRGSEWVPLETLPRLHWADSGAEVDPRIVQWWVIQCIQQKSPQCGPLLRRYLAMCPPPEVAALARFVLSSWISHDTVVPSHEEAAERATKEADKLWSAYSQHQYYVDSYQGKKENLYQQLYQKFSTECKGSAIDQKGMLAIVAAAGDGECVKLCEQYIRKWFGNRLAQCKCLVEVLAWAPHPLAIQVLLGLANRFRTKAIRQAAEEHVQALADREGWTIDELADRTIPDAGFERPTDENDQPIGHEAVLTLDYGPRRFTVKLDDDLQPIITTEEGKSVKNPPAPGKNDDADKAKAAKKAFSDAKKVVKEVVKRQTERLYEALCTQRSWEFGDWRRYLADHPIVGRLCTRAAWAAFALENTGGQEQPSERFLGCFRPLEDGSLTSEKDEEVRHEETALVRLAHTCNTPAELAQAWQQHFEDYDVTPLFPQFGRATFTLPQSKRKETEIKDFEGHLLTTFKLRGKATKLGWLRGEAEDGGCFYLYRKPFPSLGLQAIVEFTGSFLPEQDMPAALTNLCFTRIKGDREAAWSWQPDKLELGQVPPVLLSECYDDMKQIAAEGSGYDPKWQVRSPF